jgi:hypothetical protein
MYWGSKHMVHCLYYGKAMNQTVDMFKATKVDIKLIEPEVTYKAGDQGWMS